MLVILATPYLLRLPLNLFLFRLTESIFAAPTTYTRSIQDTHTRMDVDGAAITAVCSMILAIKHHHFRLEAGREDSQNVRKHSMLLDCTA